jgi:hypothetical protein
MIKENVTLNTFKIIFLKKYFETKKINRGSIEHCKGNVARCKVARGHVTARLCRATVKNSLKINSLETGLNLNRTISISLI